MRRSELLVRSWDRAVHAAARVGYSLPPASPRQYGVRLHRNIPYRNTGSRSHLLDVYEPVRPGPHPALMYVHGGGFAVLSKDTHRIMALSFASQGYTVFNINYRLGPKYLYPAPLDDAAAALAWVKEHGERYGADPERLSLAGESAGANLVTALTYVATHLRPEPFAARLFEKAPKLRSVLSIYGLHDMHDLERFSNPRLSPLLKIFIHRAAAAYVGRPVRRNAPRAPLASPLRLFEDERPTDVRPVPPFFIACGTADPLLTDSKQLHRVLKTRGVHSELSIHPGEIHGFNAMLWRREARQKWRAAFEFLDRHSATPS